MIAALLLGVFGGFAFAQGAGMPGGRIINLDCMQALVAVGEPELAGVFSFVSDHDSAAAFADLLVHKQKDMKRFISREQGLLKKNMALPRWDHDAVAYILGIYANPPPGAPARPSDKMMKDLAALFSSPAATPSGSTTLERRR